MPPAKAAPAAARKASPGTGLLFLREEEMRLAQDLLFFANRDLSDAADEALEDTGLGRAHHRVLHFVGARPGLSVGDLLEILGITKQSLARVLTALIEERLVVQKAGRNDRRHRHLFLSEAGTKLERELFENQRERLLAAYREAGGPAVEGFRRVMVGIMGKSARAYIDAGRPTPPAPAKRRK